MTTHDHNDHNERRANPMGAYVATVGAIILLVSIWLDWLTKGPGDSEGNPSSGYEGDGVIPLMAYLGVGFAVALLYATKRADRRQHRGLSLASFAVGLASLLWIVSFLLDPISTTQYNENVSTEFGVFVGLVGSLLWAVGSFLLAKEPEGDFEDDHHVVSRPVATHTTTARVDHDVHQSTGGLGNTGATGTAGSRGATDAPSTGDHNPDTRI